jgi:formylglycine-generating enzyme required for sulfatase activity
MKIFLSKALFFFILFPCIYSFGITLPHQGRVSVLGTPFDGNASFQFALVDQSGNIVWNHEGGTVTANPTSVLTLEVINGFYKCNLGDTSINGMASLSSDLFDINNQLSLRIWFDDGINGLQQLGTDQPLHVAPYALSASYTRTAAELISAQLGESISSQASASGMSESNLTKRISLLAANASDTGQVTTATMDPTLLNDLNRTRETEDIADGNITSEKLSSTLLEYLKPKLISSPSLPTESGGIIYSGQSLTLSVEVEGRNLSYQWQKNGVDLPGEINETLQIADADATLDDGNYSVSVSNDFGNVTSATLTLDINTSKIGSPFGDIFYVKSADNMELLWVQPGTFEMGSPLTEDNRSNDETQRNVTISNGFYLGRFEVSQHEYFKVMNSNTDDLFARPSFDQDDSSKPVESVSWNDINSTFLPLLNKLESDNGNLPNGWTYSLPTEAEWEFSCRAGTSTSYSYGDSSSTDDANYNGSSTKVIGFYNSNAWGFYDMHGNVEEWVSDWYGDYNTSSLIDPVGPIDGTKKVYRGGRYSSDTANIRSANRGSLENNFNNRRIGFRLALKKVE